MNIVQILGVEGSEQTRSLIANVQTALSTIGLEAEISLVLKVEELMKFKINGIPAMVFNGKVIVQKVVPNVVDLKILLQFLILRNEENYAMKNILVPVDFSENSACALRFAFELATAAKSSLTVLHVCHPEYDPNLLFPEMNFADLESFNQDRLDHFIKETLPEQTKVSVIPALEVGFAVEEITKRSESTNYDLLILGSRGDKGLVEKIFGAVSVSIAQLSKCPVLLIPEGGAYREIKHILFASNFESTTPETLRILARFTNTFSADIHFVHVTEGVDTQEYKRQEKRLFNVLFEGGEPTFSFTMTQVQGESVADALNEYALANSVDLIILAHLHRSFWESIFHKSVTKKMTLNTRLPLMVIPAK